MLATGIKTPVGVKISGADLDVIEEIAIAVERAVADIPGTTSAYAERPVGGRYIEIDIDRAAAARYALSIADVQQVVQTAIGGQTIAESVEGLERFPINLRYPRDWRDSPDQHGQSTHGHAVRRAYPAIGGGRDQIGRRPRNDPLGKRTAHRFCLH